MNWIDKLERRYGNLGIPYLINGLMIGQLAAGLIVLLFDWKFASMISLSRISVLQGQIWRLVTFLFQPIWLGGVLGVLNLVFYFWIGNHLQGRKQSGSRLYQRSDERQPENQKDIFRR